MSNMLLGTLHYQVMRDGLFAHEKYLNYVAGGALNTREKITKFVRDCATMNADAFNLAYNQGCRATALRGAVVYQPTLVQLYKNLTCFMYQADYDENTKKHAKTTAIFTELLAEIAYHIINAIPEYQDAPWSAQDRNSFKKLQVNTNPTTLRLKTILKTAKRL